MSNRVQDKWDELDNDHRPYVEDNIQDVLTQKIVMSAIQVGFITGIAFACRQTVPLSLPKTEKGKRELLRFLNEYEAFRKKAGEDVANLLR